MDNWTARTFVSLFWQVTTLEAHTFRLFHTLCVTQGAARSWCVQILFVLWFSQCVWRKSDLKRNLTMQERFSLVYQSIVSRSHSSRCSHSVNCVNVLKHTVTVQLQSKIYVKFANISINISISQAPGHSRR